MAKDLVNDKGFKIIELNNNDIIYLHSKIGSLGICDYCNNPLIDGKLDCKSYYIAVLNSIFCPKCFSGWLKRANKYKEDEPIENKSYEYYKNLFKRQWEQTSI